MTRLDQETDRLGGLLMALCLFTLPWVGVGVVYYFTGRDLGGGLQPAWIFLLPALVLQWSRKSFRGGACQSVWKMTLAVGVALLISLLGIWLAPSQETIQVAVFRWVRQSIQLAIMFGFLWWAASLGRGSGGRQRFLDWIFWGAAFQIVYSLLQEIVYFHPWASFIRWEEFFTSNPSILSGSGRLYLNNSLQDIPRLRGTMCEPLYLGNYLLMIWPFLLVWRRPLRWRWVLGLVIALVLILTWSRGAWLAGCGQLLMLALLAWRAGKGRTIKNHWFSLGGWLLGVVALVLLDAWTGSFLGHRLWASFNNQDWSNLTRLYSMKAAWAAFLSSPWVGIGWGQFGFHFPLLVDPMGLQSQFSWPVVNNFPLRILCETGLLGMTVFVGTIFLVGRRTWLFLGSRDQAAVDRDFVTAAAVSCTGIWIQLLTFSQYNLPHIWVAAGLLLAGLARGVPSAGGES